MKEQSPTRPVFCSGECEVVPPGREVVRRDVPGDRPAKESGDRKRSLSSSSRPHFLQVVVQVGREIMFFWMLGAEFHSGREWCLFKNKPWDLGGSVG